MDALLNVSYTETNLSDNVQQDYAEGEAVETGGSYHLKSALRTHDDYRKNYRCRQDLTILMEYKTGHIAYNPCKLLPLLWSHIIVGIGTMFNSNAYEEIKDHYRDEDMLSELLHLTEEELPLVMSQEDASLINEEATRIVDESWRLDTFLGRLNGVRWFLTHLIINHNRGESGIEDGLCYREGMGVFTYYLGDTFSITTSKMWANVDINGDKCIIHMDHIVNVLDKLTERYNSIIYNRMCRSTSMSTIYPPDNMLQRVIAIGDGLIMSEGNEAYRGLACFEALCVGEIINKGDSGVWDVNKFLRTMKHEVGQLGAQFDHWCTTLCKILADMNTQQISCLHGLYRIWGHPVVDLEKGLEKLRSVALVEKCIPRAFSVNTSNMFKETFFMNYYKKHKFYPPYTWVGPSGSHYLQQNLILEKEIDRHNIRYHIEDWQNVQCEKTFEIPATYSLASCIKDRAISPTRSELSRMVQSNRSVMNQEARRGVLKWLNSSMVPVREFLQDINDNSLHIDDCIIGLYPKERELKLEARYFALMSFRMRLYFTITEHLANDHLLEYFPMVTMSDSMLELQKKLDALSRKQTSSKRGVIHYVVNIDFRKWNQQMREEMTIDLFNDTDRLFGFNNLVGRTHEIFRRSYIYLSSGEYVPSLNGRGGLRTEAPYSWTKDPSGKEGLRQKYWTIMTACDLMVVARKFNMKIDLVGGGDNQVLIVEVSTDRINHDGTMSDEGKAECQEKMNSFMTSLSEYMESKGLPLKVEETWISPDLLMFFKMMYFRHVTLISPLKQASRVFPLSNDQVMTIGNMASTISSAVTVLSSKDMQIGPAIMLGRMSVGDLSVMVCNNHPLSVDKRMWSEKVSICRGGARRTISVPPHRRTPTRIFQSLTLHHKVLGGSAIISPLGMLMRGFPDPLCEHLTWMSMLTRPRPEYKVFSCMSMNNKTPWSHLLEDPVSVNHDAPIHGLAVLRREAENALASASKYTNKDFLELAHTCNKQMVEGLADALCSGDNIDIRILHDIMGANLGGYFNSIASKVNKASTVLRMNKTSKVIETITGQEKVCMSYYVSYGMVDHDLAPMSCPTATARRYRTISWGKNIMGITTPHPAAFLSYTTGPHECDHNYVQTKTMSAGVVDPLSRGPFHVYQGSYTKEKFKPTEMAAAYGEEDLLSRAIHLMKLINWRYSQDSSMARVIRGLLGSLTDADPSMFYGMMEWISGDAEHRYQDMATKHGGVPNIAYSILSYVRANTSTFRRHSRGGKNETIHFQAVIIYTSMMSLFKHYGGIGHWHETCDKCISRTTVDPDFQFKRRVAFPMLPGNMFAYVPSEMIKFHYHDLRRIKAQEMADERIISLSCMNDGDRAVAACSLLSGVIAASQSKDRSSDTVSSITMWSSIIHAKDLIPMVCLRLSVDHLMKRKEWVWPKPHVPQKVAMLLEPFIMSPSGRCWLSSMGLDISELGVGQIGVLRDIIHNVVDGRIIPRVIPNRVSPLWTNDVICAKIFENTHIVQCDDCLNRGSTLVRTEICNDMRMEYLFKICSITLPVFKGDMTQIEMPLPITPLYDWESSPVQVYNVLSDGTDYIPFPKDGPITRSIPLGASGVSSMLDILHETKGTILVSTDAVSLMIWRKMYGKRVIKIYNDSHKGLDSVCEMNAMTEEVSDRYLDDEHTNERPDVICCSAYPEPAGWCVVTSRDELNSLHEKAKHMTPVSVMVSSLRCPTRVVCAIRLDSGDEGGWGNLQSLYRSLEARCQPHVSQVKKPSVKTKLISQLVSLFQACDGSFQGCLDSLIISMRSMVHKREVYSRRGRDAMYMLIILELVRHNGGVSKAFNLGRIKYVNRPRMIRASLTNSNNRKAASDVRDAKEVFKRAGVDTVICNDNYVRVIL
ncbi:RNA-dependent RNA polymerase [Clerodendrum chlorotic spot virus]|uniref:RNA-directed RNA polymerase n=1 Tax=Clerodendrum chlorotic spot virus TaxID=1064520 RepID=A0A2U9Q3D3_9RHAB|nr:RNA-dependent RNA polymerase [Clerodendrum chlorotic spot virus]AWT62665.1 RNA-dependent RNA polymerase [Clerodendrum chlorotic spot virus]